MATSRTATLTLRIDPGVKEGLRLVAEKERRSLANMLEVMIRSYCADKQFTVLEQQMLFPRPSDTDNP